MEFVIIGSVSAFALLVKSLKRIKKCKGCFIECEQNTAFTPNNTNDKDPVSDMLNVMNRLNEHNINIQKTINKNNDDISYS